MSESGLSVSSPRLAKRMVLTGRVQGLGVRPAIYRLAEWLGLYGVVRNMTGGVVVEVEGHDGAIAEFARRLTKSLPRLAEVDTVEVAELSPRGRTSFTIESSETSGSLATLVPRDLAVCDECREDVTDPRSRYYMYPFASCTCCGPRYSLIRAMPFDRRTTDLAEFQMCPECRTDYSASGNRRFHAQTTACGNCGPMVWGSSAGSGSQDSNARIAPAESVRESINALRQGRVLGLKGVGGYQLLVDATNERAVRELRRRKARQHKPLGLLVDSVTTAQSLGELSAVEQQTLASPVNPMVLAQAKRDPQATHVVGEECGLVGLMLPTTPLHELIVKGVARPLVCTSANLEGNPLEYAGDDIVEASGLCDLWVHHNRDISRPIDDSVVRVIAGRAVTLRLGRGLAPLPLQLPAQWIRGEPRVFAVGGFLKSAAAWCNGQQAVLGPHIGDQQTLATRERFLQQTDQWCRLYRFEPQVIAHDLHPDYFSTRWSQEQPQPSIAVQHHHAHVVASMIEHQWLDREVLGVAWDGTGFGSDATTWGGEFLLSTARQFQRLACLRPFRLPGGEAAVKEPWRVAVSLAAQSGNLRDLSSVWTLSDSHIETARKMAQSKSSPACSSVGRLFDGVAALILGKTHARFDSDLAMQLEFRADGTSTGEYPLRLTESRELTEIDWRPLIQAILDDRRSGAPVGCIAQRFHRTLARCIVNIWERLPRSIPLALSGGVFQNKRLCELLVETFSGPQRQLGLPGILPVGDGGLAAGQLAVALARLSDGE